VSNILRLKQKNIDMNSPWIIEIFMRSYAIINQFKHRYWYATQKPGLVALKRFNEEAGLKLKRK